MSNSREAMALARLADEGRRYWASASGQAIWRAERACIGPLCERWFGPHALELGFGPALTDMCPVHHSIRWSPTEGLVETPSTLVCPPDALPLPDGCLSLVVVHHLLEVLPNPHHVLQEAARVTADEGHLVLFAWSPFGIAGGARLWPERRRHFPGRGRWRSPARLRDWLTFVDFETHRVDYCGFRLPGGLARNAVLETVGRRHNLPLGDCYMIHARRRSQLAQPRRGKVSFAPPLPGSALGGATRIGRQSDKKVKEGE